jgi:alpha-galactosidase
MDIDARRLDFAYKLCTRYADELGCKLNIEKTLDREESLKNADFVINTARHVNYDLWKRGRAVAKRYGYRYGGSLN